ARGENTGIVESPAIEPHLSRNHIWTTAPAIGRRVVDLRDGCGCRERSTATEHVEFPANHRRAGRRHWRWHRRTRAPSAACDIIDLQVRYFCGAIVTTGDIELAVNS